jgi:hypothetical protein
MRKINMIKLKVIKLLNKKKSVKMITKIKTMIWKQKQKMINNDEVLKYMKKVTGMDHWNTKKNMSTLVKKALSRSLK